MKTKSMFGILAAVLLVVSFVVPSNLARVEAASDATARWAMVDTPNSLINVTKEVFNGSFLEGAELLKLAVSSTPGTMYLLATAQDGVLSGAPLRGRIPLLYKTTNGGVSWSMAASLNLFRDIGTLPRTGTTLEAAYWVPVWDIAVAPDDAKVIAVVLDDSRALINVAVPDIGGPRELWISTDGGASWNNTNIGAKLVADGVDTIGGYISCIDISPAYGGNRDIAIGIRSGGDQGNEKIYTAKMGGFGSWNVQDTGGTPASTGWPTTNLDVFNLKFSPTYVGDSALTVVYADTNATWFIIGIRDLNKNTTTWSPNPIRVERTTGGTTNESPDLDSLVAAGLQLPSDFSGASPSLRRAYISLDAWSDKNATTDRTGIYRIDDTVVYELMDTSTIDGKDIASIAYFGTFASGKLLAGERFGDPCWATVPTWFTDSPTVCPIPCWYPALKPPTGAAGCYTYETDGGTWTTAKGWGNALVYWNPDGTLAYTITSSATLGEYVAIVNAQDVGGPFLTGFGWLDLLTAAFSAIGAFGGATGPAWPQGLLNRVPYDESAFSISRNNGETWNQLSLIDTYISKLTDVAPSGDCSTLYLASSNNLTCLGQTAPPCFESLSRTGRIGFDSVWRSSSNPAVAAPLPAMPVGTIWERVLARPTAVACNGTQTNFALLRLPPPCDEPTGQNVFWAAMDTSAVMWSPDFGDYWVNVNTRLKVQDMAAESATILYILQSDGMVQRLPYTGTAWSSVAANGDSFLSPAHTIEVIKEGKVLVGAGDTASFNVSYSSNSAETFAPSAIYRTVDTGNMHVLFDPKFNDNSIFFLGAENSGGTIWRGAIPFAEFQDMLFPCTDAHKQYYGLQAGFTGNALYGAHAGAYCEATATVPAGYCTVERTIYRYLGLPKPGIPWDHLDVGTDGYLTIRPAFTLQPESLKSCGCCTMDTDTILYAIDNAAYSNPYWSGSNNSVLVTCYGQQLRTTGMLWRYIDCFAKKGPTLVTADGTLIGCDPVSGRAQEVNLCWEQLCLATGYDIEIAKDNAFTIRVLDWVGTCNGTAYRSAPAVFRPVWPLTPCAYIPAGGSFSEDAKSTGTAEASAIAFYGQLECGHKYFWRIQVRGDAWGGYVRSPWSETRSFTIKAGLPVRADYYGLKLLAPDNGCLGCPVKPASFSWSPFKETTKYKFVLAKDAAMTQVVAEAEVPTTAYEYNGTLDYSTNYFWRVMSLAPAPSDWSATFSFQTEAAPPPPAAQAPSKTGALDSLAMPVKAISAWLSTLNLQFAQAAPLPLWVPVSIAVGVGLFILWLVVMIAIAKVTGNPFGKIRRS